MRIRTVILMLGMLLVASLTASACDKDKAQMTSTATTAAFTINGMHCGDCASSVKQALAKLEGVQNVIVSYEYSKAFVEYNPEKTNFDQMAGTVQTAGFTVVREIKDSQTAKLSSEKSCSAADMKGCSGMKSQLSSQKSGAACCAKKAENATEKVEKTEKTEKAKKGSS